MAEGISLREFGRQLDVTAEAVRKAIASGKIPADCVGEIVLTSGRARPCIVNPARAAEHWGKNRDPNQVRDKASLAAGAKRGWAQRRGEAPPEDEPDDELADDGAGTGLRDRLGSASTGAKSGEPSIADYKRITEAYKARTAKVEYEQLVGALVPAGLIEAKYVGLMTALRNRVLGVPSEAKGKIPHLTVDEIEVLEDLIVSALEEAAAEEDDDDDN